MARIPYPDVEKLPPETRDALKKIRGINVFKLTAWADQLAPSFFGFVTAIFTKTSLDPKLRQIAILRVGNICGSPYEIYQHEGLARIVGLTEQQIAATRDGTTVAALDDKQLAVLRFAEEMTAEIRVSDTTFTQVRSFLPEKELTELAIITSFYSAICRYLETMEIEIEAKDVSRSSTEQ